MTGTEKMKEEEEVDSDEETDHRDEKYNQAAKKTFQTLNAMMNPRRSRSSYNSNGQMQNWMTYKDSSTKSSTVMVVPRGPRTWAMNKSFFS